MKAKVDVEELIDVIFSYLSIEDIRDIMINKLASLSVREQVKIISQSAERRDVLQQALEAYDRERVR